MIAVAKPLPRRTRLWIPEAPYLKLRRYVEVGVIRRGIGVEGYFTVELVHARTGVVKRRLRFRNLITNAGLNALAGGAQIGALINYLAVGTGSAEPDVEDTALVSEIGPRTNSTGGFTSEVGSVGSGAFVEYWWRRITRVFTESQANGNLAELGFYDQPSGGTLWNRQLFLDEQQEPTVITKTSDDQLRVIYEYRIYPPMLDNEQDITINGVPTHVINRVCQVANSVHWGDQGALSTLGSLVSSSNALTAYSGPIGNRDGNPSGSPVNATSCVTQSYTAGTFYRERQVIWGPSVANFAGGIYSISSFNGAFSGSGRGAAFQVSFDPPIMKTDTQRLIVLERWTYNRIEI